MWSSENLPPSIPPSLDTDRFDFSRSMKQLKYEDMSFMDDERPAIAVFDGAGGAKYGRAAAERAYGDCYDALHAQTIVSEPRVALAGLHVTLSSVHETLLKRYHGQGYTTAVIAKVFRAPDHSLYAAVTTVGDSRLYLQRERGFTAMTLDGGYDLTDRSPANRSRVSKARQIQDELAHVASANDLTDDLRGYYNTRHHIVSGLGAEVPLRIGSLILDLLPGDTLCLTSDGVHDNLTDEEMQSIARKSSTTIDQLVSGLVNAAFVRSKQTHIRAKQDDITAVAMLYKG